MAVENPLIAFSGFHPDFKELVRYFELNKVYTIQIESNLACEQGCLYCYASSNNDRKKELGFEIIKKTVQSARAMKIKAVDWLGGDPLLRSNWYELMRFAKDLGLKNNIWTSGLPLADWDTAKKAVEVSEGGFISVHLDTLNEELYEKLHTGDARKKIDGILQGVDNVLSLCKDGSSMYNCITFTRLLADQDVRETMEYFFREKGMRTCLTQMCRIGEALKHPDWLPDNNQIEGSVRSRDSINYPHSDISMSTMDTNKFYCGGTICVTIDGDVTPCSVIRKGYGNVKFESLKSIINKNAQDLLFLKLRDEKNLPDSCQMCENNSACWGCRATAYYEEGDILAGDHNCSFMN